MQAKQKKNSQVARSTGRERTKKKETARIFYFSALPSLTPTCIFD